MDAAATAVFWGSLAAIGYIFAGYPLLVRTAAQFWPAAEETTASNASVSILTAAGNEAARLPAKLDSLLACDGADRITEIVVGSDGSTDETVATLQAYPDRRVRVVAFEQRRGKSAVLADLIPTLTGDVVILTDARQAVSPAAIEALTTRLTDPAVGVVSGELIFVDSDGSPAAEGMGAYWTYEKLIRKAESRFRSVPGATGALYAVRRSCLRPPPDDALLDDVAIPMRVVEQGYRCVFEPKAIAYDRPSGSTTQESVRKRRTIAGVVQLVMQHPRWLVPRWLWRQGNPIWWEFVSHKVARLLAPPLLLGCLVANVWLAAGGSSPYSALLLGQTAFYGAAAAGWLAGRMGRPVRLLSVPLMFLALNGTTVLALWDAARGRFAAAWKRA